MLSHIPGLPRNPKAAIQGKDDVTTSVEFATALVAITWMTALAEAQVSLKDRKEAAARLVLQTIVESHASSMHQQIQVSYTVNYTNNALIISNNASYN